MTQMTSPEIRASLIQERAHLINNFLERSGVVIGGNQASLAITDDMNINTFEIALTGRDGSGGKIPADAKDKILAALQTLQDADAISFTQKKHGVYDIAVIKVLDFEKLKNALNPAQPSAPEAAAAGGGAPGNIVGVTEPPKQAPVHDLF